METWSKEEMSALFHRMCKVKLPSFLRELRATEEDSQSSLMQLFKKRKEVREMEKAMAEKEEAFRERMKGIADRWRDLHAKRAQLKAHVERSGSTVQKSEELRIQALKTDRKQREENIKMAGELLRFKMELETLRKKHCKLCKKVQKYSIFKKYLEDVVEISQSTAHLGKGAAHPLAVAVTVVVRHSGRPPHLECSNARQTNGEGQNPRTVRAGEAGEIFQEGEALAQFEDISEVISEYMLLVRTRKDLLQSQQGHKQLTEQDKVFLEQYKAQKEAEMLQYQNELGQLKLRIYQAQSDIPLWEAHWADIQDRTSKKTGKLWTIKLAIHNLFQSTNLRLQAQRSTLECTSCRQLSMIQQFIQDLKDFQLYIKMQKHQRVATPLKTKGTWQHDLSCQ